MRKFHSMKKLPLIAVVLVTAAIFLAGKMLEDTPMLQPNPFKTMVAPPIPVSMTVQQLKTPINDGNVLFTATYTQEQVGDTREFSVFLNAPNSPVKKQMILHDDGRNGDEVAGDLVFTASSNENIKLFKKTMAGFEKRLQLAGNKVISFSGRSATVVKKDRLFDMDGFERFEKVAFDRTIFDVPFTNGPKNKNARSGDETSAMDSDALTVNEAEVSESENPNVTTTADPFDPSTGTICDPFIDRFKSLFITDISVTEDPVRTFNPCTGVGNPNGAWTFGTLMANMANQPVTGVTVDIFTQEWLDTWMQGTPRLTPGTTNPVVNTQVLDSRVHPVTPLTTQASSIMHTVIRPWLRAAAGSPTWVVDSLPGSSRYWRHLWDKLVANGTDVMSFAPFKLTAIVNRVDLSTITSSGGGYGGTTNKVTNGGEGRFVYSIVKDPASNCSTAVSSLTQAFVGFNVILEYGIPIDNCEKLLEYQENWRSLSDIPFGATFNTTLEKITDLFTAQGANPNATTKNLSALNQLRTNEICNSSLLSGGAPFWQLREFVLGGNFLLGNTTTKLEPMSKFNGAVLNPLNAANTTADIATLAAFVNANTAAIEANNYTVPLTVPASGGGTANFLAGRADVHSPTAATTNHHWNGRGTSGASTFINSDSARFMFSLNTCSGCHGGETGTGFVHVRYIGFGHNISATSTSGGLRDISSFLTGLGADAIGTDNDNDPNGLFFVADVAGRPTGAPRIRGFNDLLRREIFMKNLLCNKCGGNGIVFEFATAVFTERAAKTH